MDRSRDWFDQAVGDLEHAKADLERGFYDWACFSSQQAAEKALKAVFQRMGAEAWGHSVADLLEELAKVHQVPVDLITRPLSSTRFTSQPDIPTPTRAAPQGVATGRGRPGGLSPMARRSSNSVKVFYPQISREEVLRRLADGLPSLQRKVPLLKVVLFGSYARGDYTVSSDVDLLIIYKGEPREDLYALVKRLLRIPGLEPHLYSDKEYEVLRPSLERAISEGVVLFSDV